MHNLQIRNLIPNGNYNLPPTIISFPVAEKKSTKKNNYPRATGQATRDWNILKWGGEGGGERQGVWRKRLYGVTAIIKES